MRHSNIPFEGTPTQLSVASVNGRRGVQLGGAVRRDGILPPGNVFRDEVVISFVSMVIREPLYSRGPPQLGMRERWGAQRINSDNSEGSGLVSDEATSRLWISGTCFPWEVPKPMAR